MWHVSSRSGVATLRTAIHLLLTYLLTYLLRPVEHQLSADCCGPVRAVSFACRESPGETVATKEAKTFRPLPARDATPSLRPSLVGQTDGPLDSARFHYRPLITRLSAPRQSTHRRRPADPTPSRDATRRDATRAKQTRNKNVVHIRWQLLK